MFDQTPDPLAKLPALAARLGVAPTTEGDAATVQLRTRSGERYDLWALITAFLDRIEQHAALMSAVADDIKRKAE